MTQAEMEARDIKALESRDMKDTSLNPHLVGGVDANAEYVGANGIPDATTASELNPDAEY